MLSRSSQDITRQIIVLGLTPVWVVTWSQQSEVLGSWFFMWLFWFFSFSLACPLPLFMTENGSSLSLSIVNNRWPKMPYIYLFLILFTGMPPGIRSCLAHSRHSISIYLINYLMKQSALTYNSEEIITCILEIHC